MRVYVYSAAAIVCLLAVSTISSAQGFGVESKSAPSIKTVSNLHPFTSLEGNFSIALPKVVSSFSPISDRTPVGVVTGMAFSWRMAEGLYGVTFVERPESSGSPDAKLVLDSVQNQLHKQVEAAHGRLLKENSLSLSNVPGRELKFEMPDALLTLRLYLAGSRLYQLFLSVPRKQQQEAVALEALDSFKILSASDVEAASRKNIQDETPPPLPQEPVAKKLKSDAYDEGLKGKVKMVAAEDEDLSGTWSVGKRKRSHTYYYNEAGNLLKKELYDYRGNLMEITVYGYLDGERVNKSKFISHEYDPPPGMAPPPAAGQALAKRDQRYSTKYRYKYDGKGRPVETLYYHNDGTQGLRYVYNYNGNQREELVYTSEGSLNQRYLSMLDENGNKTEWTVFDAKDGSMRNKYSYKYEFDDKGNWIKQTTLKATSKDGSSVFEPAYTTYRTITYY